MIIKGYKSISAVFNKLLFLQLPSTCTCSAFSVLKPNRAVFAQQLWLGAVQLACPLPKSFCVLSRTGAAEDFSWCLCNPVPPANSLGTTLLLGAEPSGMGGCLAFLKQKQPVLLQMPPYWDFNPFSTAIP